MFTLHKKLREKQNPSSFCVLYMYKIKVHDRVVAISTENGNGKQLKF